MRRSLALVPLVAAALVARAEDKSPLEGAWDLTFTFKGQRPDSEKARLVLTNAQGAWGGSIAFERNFNANKQALTGLVVEGDKFRFEVGGSGLPIEGRLDKSVLVGKWSGTAADGAPFEIPWSGVRAAEEPPVERFEKGFVFDGYAPQGKAEDLGMDGAALDDLIRDAAKSDSDALLVLREGKVVAERSFGRGDAARLLPAPTQFVAAFAPALLVEDRKIASFDAPVSTWFADWKDGRKAKATLRHLLTRTSGLDFVPAAKLRAARDQVALARGLPVADVPGETWSAGDDAAVALVSGIVAKAAGRPMDEFLKERLFAPLSIVKFEWKRDGAGNAPAWEGLAMSARDLARIGRLVAEDGEAGGAKAVSRASIDALSAPESEELFAQGCSGTCTAPIRRRRRPAWSAARRSVSGSSSSRSRRRSASACARGATSRARPTTRGPRSSSPTSR
jgi:CubicO group peptidase (beta-lactamase class C family)